MLEEQIMHQQQQQQQQQQKQVSSQQQLQQHSQQQQQHSNTENQNSTTAITATTTHHHHYHHQRAPRTPESYFNVPESIALLNIVKSDRIQSAFQSNRKNHASVWEMVADILSRYNNRKRSAKQCCNRYENLKKIYTQLKRNPEKHVRRNWPYMYLFRQIEEQRGESWGSSAKRRNELSYYQRRRALMLMNNNSDSSKDLQTELIKIQQPIIPVIATNGINNNSNINNSSNNININNNNNINGNNNNGCIKEQQAITFIPNHFIQNEIRKCELLNKNSEIEEHRNGNNNNRTIIDDLRRAFTERRNDDEIGEQGLDLGARDISGNRISAIRSSTSSQINLDNFDFGGLMNIKEEPTETDYEEPDRDLTFSRINNNYNGNTHLYMNGHHNNIGRNNDDINCNDDLDNDDNDETNILHPDVIVDTDHVTDSSTSNSILNNSNNNTNNVRKKRKLSTSSDDDDDDDDSTNYELIEYLKRREKHDEKMLKRMEEREERLIKLLERTVVAIERIASHNCNNNNNSNNNNNNSSNNISPNNITNSK